MLAAWATLHPCKNTIADRRALRAAGHVLAPQRQTASSSWVATRS